MKRLCVILLAIVIVFTGCSKPERMWEASTVAEDILPYAERAVEILEGYQNGEYDARGTRALFNELYEKIDELNINFMISQGKYFSADLCVYNRIEYLARGTHIKYLSDADIEKHIALFRCFQYGEISKQVYPPDELFAGGYDPDEYLGDLSSLATDYFASIETQYPYIHVTFDYINGVKLKDFFSYVKKLNSNLIETGKLKNLHVEYRCYDQHVISVSIRTQVGEPDISYWMFGRNYDCDDMSEVKAAIKKAEKAFPYR